MRTCTKCIGYVKPRADCECGGTGVAQSAKGSTTTLSFVSDEYVAGVLKRSLELQKQIDSERAAREQAERERDAAQSRMRDVLAAMHDLDDRSCPDCGFDANDNHHAWCPRNRETP